MPDSPAISLEEISALCLEALPWALEMNFQVTELGHGPCRVLMPYQDRFVRPGGTVSGPAMMSLADYAMYVAVLSAIGRVELAVTINLNINFLRRPPPEALEATVRLLKLGRRLAVGEVDVSGVGEGAPLVAHVTATYSIPPSPST